MYPATHAAACSASTSELRATMCARAAGVAGAFRPGRGEGVVSGVTRCEIAQTTYRRAEATRNEPTAHGTTTRAGAAFQRRSVVRVGAMPGTRARARWSITHRFGARRPRLERVQPRGGRHRARRGAARAPATR